MNIFDKLLKDDPHTKGLVITQPTLLSDCPATVTLDEKEKYNIEIEPGEFLVINMGFSVGKPGAKFTHTNVAYTQKKIHEFKHYRKGGGKLWTSRAGIDLSFIVPRNQVTLLPEKGYSYVKVEINGVKVSFNVSGGGGGGWTDYLTTFTSTGVNHKLSDVKKIAEVSVRNSPYEPLVAKPFDREDEWNRLSAKATPNIKEKIAKMVEDGKKPIVHFLSSYSYDGNTKGEATEVRRRYKKIPRPPAPGCDSAYSIEYTGAPQTFILNMGWNGVRAKVTQIDWYKTAQENGLIKEVVKEDPNQLKLEIA